MLITKFNKLVRSKKLWLLFAIIISVSFLSVGYGTGGCGRTDDIESKTGMAGKLFGKQISREEFGIARLHELGFREDRVPAGYQSMLNEYTWHRIAALKAADKLGLSATQEEVSEQIWTDKTFQKDGQFDPARYSDFIRMNFPGNPSRYVDYVRELITLQKMLFSLQSVYLMAPSELTREIAQRTDSISAEYVIIKPDPKVDVASLSEKDIEEAYNGNKEMFRIPAQMKVKYATFHIPQESATNAAISENTIKDYYNENIEKFFTIDTNKQKSTLPLEKVRDEIAATIAHDNAVRKVKDAAMQLVPDRKGDALSLEQAAVTYSATISTTGFFSAAERLPGIDAGLAFNKAAFDLDPNDRRNYVSDPVVSASNVYVIVALTNRPSRLPALDEVRSAAQAYAQEAAQEKIFDGRCTAIRAALKKEVESGKTFRVAAEAMQLSVHTTGVFSTMQEGSTNNIPHADLIMSSVYNRPKNDLTPPLPVEEGRLIVHVTDRSPAQHEMIAAMRYQMARYYDNVNGAMLYRSWGEYELRKGDFQSYDKPAVKSGDSPESESTSKPND